MHILKIIHGYPPDYQAGSEVYSQSLCNELVKQGHTVTVITREENPYQADFTIRSKKLNTKLNLFYINIPREKDGYKHPKLDRIFGQLLQEISVDIVHIGHLNHLSTGIVEVIKQQSLPIVFTLHDFWLMCPRGQFLQTNFSNSIYYQTCDKQENSKCANECYRAFWGNSETDNISFQYWTNWVQERMKETQKVAQLVDLFIAPSIYLKERFIQDFNMPENRIIYLDYGFPMEYLTQSTEKILPEVFTFGYIGTLIPSKGVSLLIDSFNRIKSPAYLKIWGRNNGMSFQHLNKISNGNPNIKFMGEYINKNIAHEVMSKVNCIITPSIWFENSPLVIHEAQACKVPVITANVGGMAELVQDGVNGLLFNHRNSDNLTEKMEYAINNSRIMNELGKRGYLFDLQGNIPTITEHCLTLNNIYLSLLQK